MSRRDCRFLLPMHSCRRGVLRSLTIRPEWEGAPAMPCAAAVRLATDCRGSPASGAAWRRLREAIQPTGGVRLLAGWARPRASGLGVASRMRATWQLLCGSRQSIGGGSAAGRLGSATGQRTRRCKLHASNVAAAVRIETVDRRWLGCGPAGLGCACCGRSTRSRMLLPRALAGC